MKRALALLCALPACSPDGRDTRLALPAPPACEVPTAPRQVVGGRTGGFDLLVDDTSLYWSENAGVFSMPKCGGTPRKLAGDTFGSLHLADGTLYAMHEGAFWSLPLDGSGPVELAGGFDGGTRLAIEPGKRTALISASGHCGTLSGPGCSVPDPGLLWRVDRAGGTPVPVMAADQDGRVGDLAVTGGRIYLSGDMGPVTGLFRLSASGQRVEPVMLGDEHLLAEIFASDPSNGEIFAVGPRGPAVVRETTATTLPGADAWATYLGLALDDRYLYLITEWGGLERMPRAGGTPERLLPDEGITSVALDQEAVYAYIQHGGSARIVTFAR